MEEFEALDAAVRLVRQAKAIPERRSPALMQLARMAKKGRNTGMTPSECVQALIARYNAEFAKTKEEVIDLGESRKRAFKMNGRGKYKVWLPQALLRVCWGHRARRLQIRKRILKKNPAVRQKKKSRVALPVVSSTREWARHMRSSSTHVARVRHAICELFLCIQEEGLKTLEFVPEQWIHIALDETQEPVSMRVRSEVCQVMVLHLKLVRLSASTGNLEKLDVVLPTIVLAGATTADLYGGLLKRLPRLWMG